jgi:stalled ribosome alternative rescue factor ArfA
MKTRKVNGVAKALRTPMFRKRVERDRKKAAKRGYTKHRGEMLGRGWA